MRGGWLVALAVLAAGPAAAQGISPCGTGTKTISASVTSSNVQVNSCANIAILYNITSQEVFYAVGTASTQAAAVTDFSLPGNTYVVLGVPRGGYIAAITASSTSTIRVVPGVAN
jgi:hypothetical protein